MAFQLQQQVLFDNLRAPGIAAANVLALTDPDVHLIDGRWTMFLGGFTTRFRVRLFTAVLPPGADLSSPGWTLVPELRKPKRAQALFHPARRGDWDYAAMGSPSYAEGPLPTGELVRRVYYTGLNKLFGPRRTYAIGVLEWDQGRWVRRPLPVLAGTGGFPHALEPTVVVTGGRWHLYFMRFAGDPARGQAPAYELCHTQSANGLTNWTEPQVLFGPDQFVFDNGVATLPGTYYMLTAGDAARPGIPQGLWLSSGPTPTDAALAGPRTRLLDTSAPGTPAWCQRGVCGPSLVLEQAANQPQQLQVFVTGTYGPVSWWKEALQRLRHGRLPPFPSGAFYLATARLTFTAIAP
ncbi:MAG TPA: hypothetical protein VF690_07800 [Hymenobacter sp.]|jgi:hypothetical protein